MHTSGMAPDIPAATINRPPSSLVSDESDTPPSVRHFSAHVVPVVPSLVEPVNAPVTPNMKALDRGDVYLGLHNRYIQIRDSNREAKRELAGLRRQLSEKQQLVDSLANVVLNGKSNERRLAEVTDALVNLLECVESHRNSRITPEDKVNIVQEQLGGIAKWNAHVSALLKFLHATRSPVLKHPPSVHSADSRSGRSVSPIKHWSP